MRNFWLDRIEQRKAQQTKRDLLKKIGEAVSKSLRGKKGKKDGN